MFELGEKQAAKACAEKFLTKDLWNECGVSRLASLLRLANLYITASDDESDKRRLIASFVFEGKPANVVVSSTDKHGFFS